MGEVRLPFLVKLLRVSFKSFMKSRCIAATSTTAKNLFEPKKYGPAAAGSARAPSVSQKWHGNCLSHRWGRVFRRTVFHAAALRAGFSSQKGLLAMTRMIHDRCGMTLTRILQLVLSITALAGFVGDAAANIISNPGFEDGSGGDAVDWAEIPGGPSGFVRRSSGSPASGDFAAHMAFDHIVNPAAGGAYFIEQNQGANSVNTTLKYDLRFVAKADSTDFTGANMFYQLQWLDQDASDGGGVKGETLTSLTSLGLNTSYQPFSLLDIDVPSGADSFLLRFQVAAGAVAGVANGMWVDDVSLTAVPEPASWCLLSAVGLLSLAHRRRKGSIRNPLVTTGETC